jgi:hypothetical protein
MQMENIFQEPAPGYLTRIRVIHFESEFEKIDPGLLRELTGGDKFYARDLYKATYINDLISF